MSSAFQLIDSRRSVRKFDPKPVPKDVLDKILEAARLAPSARNLQPWNFYVINDLARNQKIGKDIEVNMVKANPQYEGAAAKAGVSNMMFYDAPCVIYASLKKDGIYTREFDLGIAFGYMMLVAEELGIGTVPVGWVNEYGKDYLEKELNIPEDEYFFLALPLGYPDASVVKTPKVRRDCVVKYL